jgi:hypothetical protein
MSAIYNLIGKKAYNAKMLHAIPSAPALEREVYILQKAKGKIVLDIGASGPMHEAIKLTAKETYGIDIHPPAGDHYFKIDLDAAIDLPVIPGLELVVAGEVIEHLDNAGHFIDLLKQYDCPIVITAPNAFCEAGRVMVNTGVEMVNSEHVAYYSYWTLTTLLKKHGYKIIEWCWHKGRPNTAEGLVFLVRSN